MEDSIVKAKGQVLLLETIFSSRIGGFVIFRFKFSHYHDAERNFEMVLPFHLQKGSLTVQLFIYDKDFFYNKIVGASEDLTKELVNNTNFFTDNYYTKEIPKKRGTRKLYCIRKNSPLYSYQQNIRENFLNKIAIPQYVHGFVPASSYFNFLNAHTGKKFFIRLDIKNFFESIDYYMLKDVFSYYFRINNTVTNEEVLENFINLITLDNKLPQGSITSPTTSNIVFRRNDIRIKKYCNKIGVSYTRYADDLLFSSNSNLLSKDHKYSHYFLKKIASILSSSHLLLNNDKTIISKHSISLNGFVIDQSIRLSRKKLKKLSSILFTIERYKAIGNKFNLLKEINLQSTDNHSFNNMEGLIQYIAGYRAFLIQLAPNPTLANNTTLKYINRCENALNFLHS